MLKLNPKQLQKNRKLKQFRKQRRERAYLGQLTCAATWRPKWPAQPTRGSSLSSSPCQEDERVAGAREHASGHRLLACRCWSLPRAPRASPRPSPGPSHSPTASSPSSALSPNAPAAADVHHRGHRLPLASPTCLGAPPHRPRPLRQVKQAGTHRSTALSPSSTSDRRRSLSPPRSLRCFPEHAEATSALAVSSSTDSPFSHVH